MASESGTPRNQIFALIDCAYQNALDEHYEFYQEIIFGACEAFLAIHSTSLCKVLIDVSSLLRVVSESTTS